MTVLDFIFPKKCISCARGRRYICLLCIEKVRISKKSCIVCGQTSIDGVTHKRCKGPLGLDGAVSVWRYEKVARQAVIKLKYKFVSDIASELAYYIDSYLKDIYALPKSAILTPVPLHKSRKNWRGFNQTYVVGKILAKKRDWELIDDIVIRRIKTKPQTELKGKERVENVRGVFSINPNIKLTNKLINRSFIIFDDVWTTGTTLKEVCKVLKRNGVKNVWALTIAK